MVSPSSLINCKKCHAAKCFRHILSGNVHSSEALLASAADSDSTTWHQIHQIARQRSVPSRLQEEPVGMAERLVYFASNFSSTLPVGSEASVGFYDGRRSEPLRGDDEGANSRASSSAPTTRSRASSRSTVVPRSDVEVSRRYPAGAGRTRRSSTERDDTDANPGPSGSKRPRNLEDQDEAGPPPKRMRLRHASTRTLQTVILRLVAFPFSYHITAGRFAIRGYRRGSGDHHGTAGPSPPRAGNITI